MFSSMTRRRAGAGRYSLDDVLFEIAAMRRKCGLQDKDIFLSIGMSQTSFSRKMAGARDFSIEEIGRIADFFSARTSRALPGWPFVPDQVCAIIEARVYTPGASPDE